MVECLCMVGNSGDYKIMHIPANWACCNVHNYTEITKYWYRKDAPDSYKKAKEEILKKEHINSLKK